MYGFIVQVAFPGHLLRYSAVRNPSCPSFKVLGRPTDVQLGNYLGLFLPFLELQKNSAPGTPVYLSIVGLHAITMLRKPEDLRNDRRDMLAVLIAAGVDPERTCLYFQEDVSFALSPLHERHAPCCCAFAHVRFENTQSWRGC